MEQDISLPIISLGTDGAIAGFNNKIYKITGPSIVPINTVGSGDSFIAGIAAGLYRNYSIINTLKLGADCGTANAMKEENGFIDPKTVNAFFNDIHVTPFTL